jgi:hypothetical protein
MPRQPSPPDLLKEFVKRVEKKGSQDVSPFEEGSGEGVSMEDREFVREEMAWLADWIRKRYPKLNFGDIRRFLAEMVSVSV